MRPGVRLAIDWGKARIGVAACDRDGILAYPVETIPNNESSLLRLTQLTHEYLPIEIILGLPKALSGREQQAAIAMREVAASIANALPGLGIRLVDERLTTASATKDLHAAGYRTRKQRNVIDQVAAVALLNRALDSERHTNSPPGELFSEESL